MFFLFLFFIFNILEEKTKISYIDMYVLKSKKNEQQQQKKRESSCLSVRLCKD
jgi:hypothetical protein